MINIHQPSRNSEFLSPYRMPTTIAASKVGRRPRHPVDKLRTRIWFHVVKLRSGLPSADAIEAFLEPDLVRPDAAGVRRNRKWKGYEEGKRVPHRMKGKRYALDVAEATYPGTAIFFNSPLWAVLKQEKLSARDLDRYLLNLGPAITAILATENAAEPDADWRFKEFDQRSIDLLAAEGSFAALVATVLLMAKSEAIASPMLRDLAFNCYVALQPKVELIPEIAPFAKEIFWEIDTRCKYWVFPTTQSRLEVVIFSNELRLWEAANRHALAGGDSNSPLSLVVETLSSTLQTPDE